MIEAYCEQSKRKIFPWPYHSNIACYGPGWETFKVKSSVTTNTSSDSRSYVNTTTCTSCPHPCKLLDVIGYGIYYRAQCIIGHWIFSTAKRISSRLARICSTDNTKTDYSKTRKNPLLLSLTRGLKTRTSKISIISQKYLLTDMYSYSGYEKRIWPWLLYLGEASFLITLSRNHGPESNGWGTRLPLIVPYRLINYRPPF